MQERRSVWRYSCTHTSPYIISLFALRTAPLALGTSLAPTSATLLFSAYNEQLALPQKIANLRAIRRAWPTLEIVAFSDGSSDDTVALLRQASDIVRLIASPSRAGKAAGMRRLMREARGEIVIFTDANVILDPASIAPLLQYFSDPHVGGVAGSLRYVNQDVGATARAGGSTGGWRNGSSSRSRAWARSWAPMARSSRSAAASIRWSRPICSMT